MEPQTVISRVYFRDHLFFEPEPDVLNPGATINSGTSVKYRGCRTPAVYVETAYQKIGQERIQVVRHKMSGLISGEEKNSRRLY
jgi:hypothetical protein